MQRAFLSSFVSAVFYDGDRNVVTSALAVRVLDQLIHELIALIVADEKQQRVALQIIAQAVRAGTRDLVWLKHKAAVVALQLRMDADDARDQVALRVDARLVLGDRALSTSCCT